MVISDLSMEMTIAKKFATIDRTERVLAIRREVL
jgi:hypothetical protein